MKPAPPDPAETLHRVRQQLILAQVRIMELEDVRDEAKVKLENLETLLAKAQTLADQKLDESAHLERVRAVLQAQYEHMRHMQHVTNEALNEARMQIEGLQRERSQLQQEIVALRTQMTELSENLRRLQTNLADVQKLSSDRANEIDRLEIELKAMRATRSWRWTGWLRAIAQKWSDGKT